MGLVAERLGGRGSGEHTDDGAESGVGSSLQVERSVADGHHLRHVADARALHGVKHEGRWTSLSHVVAVDIAVKYCSQPRRRKIDVAMARSETGGGGEQKPCGMQLLEWLLRPCDRGTYRVRFDRSIGELLVDVSDEPSAPGPGGLFERSEIKRRTLPASMLRGGGLFRRRWTQRRDARAQSSGLNGGTRTVDIVVVDAGNEFYSIRTDPANLVFMFHAAKKIFPGNSDAQGH